ncbi:unnamed protein product [Paramecium sonneborni]|uniref:Palmitoyltransferase n=1 Tax=Paramecium sonneborni TaxID=65129 RepID=A0A8S1PG84_9CILI|nr:unnamed protein product [Paramecium sonneborni]
MEDHPVINEPLIELTLGNHKESQSQSFYNFMKISNVDSGFEIIEAAKYNKMAFLNKQIETVPNINQIQDQEKRTILHYLGLNSNQYIFNRLLMKYKSQKNEWLQKEDIYGLHAIHYFIYKGKVDLLEEISMIYQPKQLLGMAAINNDIFTLILVKEKMKNEKISNNYQNGVTPLHLACYFKCDYAAIVLMKWKHPLNVKDFEGNTPLHIAAKQQSSKLIRKLIQRGASTNDKNNFGQLPIDLTDDEQTHDALKSFRFSWKSLILTLNIKPRKRSPLQTFIFLIFFSCTNLGTIFSIQNTLYFNQVTGSFILLIIIVILCLISYILTLNSNPGYANIENESNLKAILLQLEPFEICYDCFIKIPNRSKHCEFCKRCINEYDHHCPWINNCVGKDNLSLFWLFLLFLFLDFVLLLVLGIQALSIQNSINTFDNFFILIILTIFEFLFLLPLGNLIFTQLKNYFSDQTTYERLILGKPNTKKRESQIQKMNKLS